MIGERVRKRLEDEKINVFDGNRVIGGGRGSDVRELFENRGVPEKSLPILLKCDSPDI